MGGSSPEKFIYPQRNGFSAFISTGASGHASPLVIKPATYDDAPSDLVATLAHPVHMHSVITPRVEVAKCDIVRHRRYVADRRLDQNCPPVPPSRKYAVRCVSHTRCREVETVRKYESCDLNKEERAMRRSKWTSALQQDETGRGFWRRVVVVIVISVGLIGAATIAGAQAGRQPQVFPLDDSPYGNTYGEWSAGWWQWLTTIPAATNPNFDLTGANCAVGQVGPVWFLAGTFTNASKITRSCTIPHGKALLFTPLTQLDGAGAFDCDPSVPGFPCDLNAL